MNASVNASKYSIASLPHAGSLAASTPVQAVPITRNSASHIHGAKAAQPADGPPEPLSGASVRSIAQRRSMMTSSHSVRFPEPGNAFPEATARPGVARVGSDLDGGERVESDGVHEV